MPSLIDIRRRVRSVRNTQQITKAMKMISAAKLRRAQDRALAARPYAQMLTNVLKSLVSRADIYDPETGQPRHPLLAQRQEHNVLLIVVTGDKGLAGAFNTNILKAAMRFLESKQGKHVEVETIGRKGRDFIRRRFPVEKPRVRQEQQETASAAGVAMISENIGVLNKIEYSFAGGMADRIIERYTHCDIDSVYVLFNEFKSVIAQRLIVEQILPIESIGETVVRQAEEMEQADKEKALQAAKGTGVGLRPADTSEMDKQAAQFATANVDYIYEQSPAELFRSLLPKYVGVQIFRALLESIAAEHAARMTAMDAATNNATDMIDSLTLAMNRVRQAKITKEIIEIVSGAAAAG